MKEKEEQFGLLKMETYTAFGEKVKSTKRNLLEFLDRCKRGRQENRCLWRGRQRCHPHELLRHGRRSRGLRSG